MITIQDLIAYRVGQYHSSADAWLEYRSNIREACVNADHVLAFLDDVADALRLDRLPIEPSRVGIVSCGVDHLTGNEATATPAPFLDPARAAERFVLVLGTNYAHKNRDLALRTGAELRRRGVEHTVVLVGAHVPFGSSREAEATALGVSDDGVIDLMVATSEERNWLLRHAEVVLYPTSAEGFGLIPFEAARFGTPTVSVGFGPISELRPDDPARATSWDPVDLADAVERLVDDPDATADAVNATLAAGTQFTWDAAAEWLVGEYRRALASHPMPDRSAPPGTSR